MTSSSGALKLTRRNQQGITSPISLVPPLSGEARKVDVPITGAKPTVAEKPHDNPVPRKGPADVRLLQPNIVYGNATVHFVGATTVEFTDAKGQHHTIATGACAIRWLKNEA